MLVPVERGRRWEKEAALFEDAGCHCIDLIETIGRFDKKRPYVVMVGNW